MRSSSYRKTVICLVGMDGTGKTTHARSTTAHLQKSGIKCKCVWFGTAYFLSYPFMIFCHILGLTKTHNMNNAFTISEHQYYKNKSVSLIWPWVQFLDVVVFVTLRVYLPLWRGFTIVCDRFIPDILVELMTDVNDDELYKKLVGQLILRLMPNSPVVFMLDVDEKIAWRRKDDVPELRYLLRRRNEYRLIGRDLRIPIINAEESTFYVQMHLLKQVDLLLSK